MSDVSGARPEVPATVVVAVDPSPAAAVALRWAATAAGAFGAELVVVHARGLLEGASGADGPPGWLVALTELVDPEIAVRLAVDDGAAPDVVLRVAEREHAGLVVVGRRGSGSPFELTLGSTSREVASRSPVPVAVVPH